MVLLAVVMSIQSQAFVHHPATEYISTSRGGHSVLLSPEADRDKRLSSLALDQLELDLKTMQRVLPPKAYDKLKQVKIWIEHDNPENACMVYHPSPEWLTQHGYIREKAKCVELGNLRHFLDWHKEQPFMVLHEFSHAFHDQVLGQSYAPLHLAYKAAVEGHKYESVGFIDGGNRKAYALTNASEYFAELSEAYFGTNDFYPYVRSELKEFDPQGYRMVEEAWNSVGD